MTERPFDPSMQVYFDYLARCEQAFRPYAPIELPEFFAGRIEQIKRLESEVGAPGRHVAIYGERGVGKTSLAQLAYFFLRRDEEDTHFVRCLATSTFDTIFAGVLAKAGREFVLNGVEAERERAGTVGLGQTRVSGRRRTRETFRRVGGDLRIEPPLLFDVFGEREGLIIIDEYDRVRDAPTHTRVAELIKHFSDRGSRTKIILVGVAETLTQLLGEHQSLSRSLAQVKLDRMSDDELSDIIAKGEAFLGTAFKSTMKHRIVRLADGFPYFVHLVCRHACRVAGRVLGKQRTASLVVAEEEYREGLADALENAEHSLVEQNQQAVITTRRKSDKFELVLRAMALSESKEVPVQDLARNTSYFVGGSPMQASSFSSTLGELAKEKRGWALTKVRDGYYKFSNPLMRPYVRFQLEHERLLIPGGQWEFPFMEER